MEQIDIEELYRKYPTLEDIALRLETSEKQAEKKNRSARGEKDETPNPEEVTTRGNRRKILATCQHAFIEKFFKGGSWTKTHHLPEAGREPYETNLQRIMSREPDALMIIVHNGEKTPRKLGPENKIYVKLREDSPASEPADQQESDVLTTIQSQLNGLEQQIKSSPDIKTDPAGQANIMQLTFAQQLKELEHTHKIESLKRDHDTEMRDLRDELNDTIADLEADLEDAEDEIEELKAELAEKDESLGGLEKKSSESYLAKTSFWGDVLTQGLEGFAKQNTKLLGEFGFPEDKIKKYFEEKDENKDKKAEQVSEASFSESGSSSSINGVYDGLDSEKKKFADGMIEIASGSEMKDLKMIASAVALFLTEEGTINVDVMKAMWEAGQQAVAAQKQNATTDNTQQ